MMSRIKRIGERFLTTGSRRILPTRLVLALWKLYGFLYPAKNLLKRKSRVSGLNLRKQGKAAEISSAFFRLHFEDDLLAFWRKHSPDRLYGGFFTHLDRTGRVYEHDLKTSAMQGRMLYGFSLGYQLTGDENCLKLARDALGFLISHCWDRKHRGWQESVLRDGRVHSADKDSFTQAYVLLGMATCHKLTHDRNALDYALKTFELMNEYAWDPLHQGYYERCQPDWRVLISDKTICIQLDMLIAVMALFECSGDTAHLLRARQLAGIITHKFVWKNDGSLLEKFTRDWEYHPRRTRDQLWIGHCFKGAWLLLELDRLTGSREHLGFVRSLLNFCLDKAWDKRYGGFYQFLFRGGRPADKTKIWWTQCEGLQALLDVYTLCGEKTYWDYFCRLLDFSFAHFHDAEHGEWVTSCLRDGTVLDGNKGGNWKAAYHTLQMCHCLQAGLAALEKEKCRN